MADAPEKVVSLVKPDPNKELVAELKEVLAQAESGEFTALVMIRRRTNGEFGTKTIGIWSDLEKVGALTFLISDIIHANRPERCDAHS